MTLLQMTQQQKIKVFINLLILFLIASNSFVFSIDSMFLKKNKNIYILYNDNQDKNIFMLERLIFKFDTIYSKKIEFKILEYYNIDSINFKDLDTVIKLLDNIKNSTKYLYKNDSLFDFDSQIFLYAPKMQYSRINSYSLDNETSLINKLNIECEEFFFIETYNKDISHNNRNKYTIKKDFWFVEYYYESNSSHKLFYVKFFEM